MNRKTIFTIALTIFNYVNAVATNDTSSPIHTSPIEMKLQWDPTKKFSRHKDLTFSLQPTKQDDYIHLCNDTNRPYLEYAITTPKGYVLKSGPLEQYQEEVVSIEDLPKGRYVLYIYSEDEIWYGYFTK